MRPIDSENPDWIQDRPLSDPIFDSLFGRPNSSGASIVENSPQGTELDDLENG